MFHRKPLIIAGMHRSGTSLLADVIHHAGVDLGIDSTPPIKHKRRGHPERKGHFEDKRFVSFHDAVIERVDPTGRFLWEPGGPIELNEGELAAARALVDDRESSSPWGWKDPRTVLFQELWANLLADAVFLFVFRRPDHVVDSLRRRGDQSLVRRVPRGGLWPGGPGLGFFRYQYVFRSWTLYNQRILNFVEQHSARSCLIDIDRFVIDPDPVFDQVRTLGIPLRPIEVSQIYDSMLMTRKPHPRVTRALRRNSEAALLYESLQSAVTVPARAS